jgi:two-component system, NtrC family, response regulator AtoC
MPIKKVLLQTTAPPHSLQDYITTAKNTYLTLQALKNEFFDLVILEDFKAFKVIKAQYPKIPLIIATPIGSIEEAVEAIRLGAIDYLEKTITAESIEEIVQKIHHPKKTAAVNSIRIEPKSFWKEAHETILGQNYIMQQILSDIAKVAQSSATVFINGESGTGKEVMAHAIHYQSPRASFPFVKVNCAAIPEALIESEFFGHEKGAFTGAIEKRAGRFELAHQGTLLLDEISEIPLNLQAKLLRVIQEQEFERVGGSKPIKVDVRLIATSNRNMQNMLKQKLFREDLYFRLNVVPLHLPPLRERKEDILHLANYFLDRFCKENNAQKKHLSEAAQKILLNYPWPGNIRELANTIERAVIMNCSGIINQKDLRLDPMAPDLLSAPVIKELTLADLEKKHIVEILATHSHNRTRAAKTLGISVVTLKNKLRLYFPESIFASQKK